MVANLGCKLEDSSQEGLQQEPSICKEQCSKNVLYYEPSLSFPKEGSGNDWLPDSKFVSSRHYELTRKSEIMGSLDHSQQLCDIIHSTEHKIPT